MNRKNSVAQKSGSSSFFHKPFSLERKIKTQPMIRKPQTARPSGSPIPQRTWFSQAKKKAGRWDHCSDGGPPPIPLDSVAATFMERTQSGFNAKVKKYVSPVFVRNIMGWNRRQARTITAIAVNALAAARVMMRPKSFRLLSFTSAKLINTAGARTRPNMARLTLQQIVMPRNKPKRIMANHPLRPILYTPF